MKKVPYGGPTNNRHHCIKFSCHGDLVSRICAPLSQTVGPNIKNSKKTSEYGLEKDTERSGRDVIEGKSQHSTSKNVPAEIRTGHLWNTGHKPHPFPQPVLKESTKITGMEKCTRKKRTSTYSPNALFVILYTSQTSVFAQRRRRKKIVYVLRVGF